MQPFPFVPSTLAVLLLLAPAVVGQGMHDENAMASMTAEEFDRHCLKPLDRAGEPPDMGAMELMHACMAPIPPGYESASDERLERVFLQRMVPHHAGAVAMAELVPARSSTPELLALARNVTATQTNESETMTRWLHEWHEAVPANRTRSDDAMRQEVARMANLSGAAFDRAFLEHMIPHHRGAINMSTVMVDRAAHPELEPFAATIVADQQREVDEMTSWLEIGFPSQGAESTIETGRATPAPSLALLLLAAFVVALARRARA